MGRYNLFSDLKDGTTMLLKYVEELNMIYNITFKNIWFHELRALYKKFIGFNVKIAFKQKIQLYNEQD